MQGDNLTRFFNIVFGPDYQGQLAIFVKQTKSTQFFQSNQLEKISAHVKKEAKSYDVYFGCGLLKDKVIKGRGKSEDVKAIPGFWLDLDLKSDAHSSENYPPTKEIAREILKKFPLKPTVIVDSGYGLHIYWLFKKLWVFKDDNERNNAETVSRNFQQAILKIFADQGYKLDYTGDLARILRVPDTLNHKNTEKPVPVKIINSKNESKRRYNLEDFLNAIEKCEQQSKPLLPRTFKKNLPRQSFPGNKVDLILERCKWFKHCLEDAKNLSEPEWFYMLTIVSFCKDAESWAHILSESYDGYDEEETINKVQRIQMSHRMPVSCDYIKSNFNNGYCKNCSHNVKTPFALGIERNRKVLEQVGFVYDDDGKPRSLNGNIFARYILQRFTLLYTATDHFYQYYDGVWNYLDHNQLSRQLRDLVHEFVPNFWTKGLEDKYLEALKREVPYTQSLNINRNYLNLVNGMLDLSSYKLESHHPKFLSSVQVPIKFNKEAKCPHFKQFLLDIFNGDKERIMVIEEIMGYCLTSKTSAQKAFLFYGKGANGKSLLAEIILNLCGKQNTSAIPLAELQNSFSRYELVGKLLNMATENEISANGLNTTAFKAIASGDPIQVEKKYEQSFMYQPLCKLVFSLNNLPYSRDKSWGFQRRLIVIPFDRTFREDDPATQNYDVLKEDLLAEMDGILNMALKGLKRLCKNNYRFSHSKAIEELQHEYKQLLNPYTEFIDEMIEQGNDDSKIFNNNMCTVFRRWSVANGHAGLAKSGNKKMLNEIRDALKDAQIAYVIGKTNGERFTGKVRFKNTRYQEQESDLSELEA